MNEPASGPDLYAHTLAAELRMLVAKLNRRLREQSHAGDLTGSQKTVLLHLEREGSATVTTLARTVGVRPQSMGATVAALQGRDLSAARPTRPMGARPSGRSHRSFANGSRTPAPRARTGCFRSSARLAPREQEALAASIELFKRLAED